MAASKPICTMPNCDKPQFTRQWCAGHYHRWRKHGDPLGGRYPTVGCAVAGCGEKHKARSFCADHYSAFMRHGDPLARVERTEPGSLLDWLLTNKDYSGDECLEWPFGRYQHGYGHTTFQGVDTTAHRAMCILAHGEPPQPGLDAAHSCHNRGCCAPRHLRWATVVENAADRVADGTAGFGANNGAAILTEADVVAIRRLRGSVGQLELAERYGTTKSNISAIQLRKSWTCIA